MIPLPPATVDVICVCSLGLNVADHLALYVLLPASLADPISAASALDEEAARYQVIIHDPYINRNTHLQEGGSVDRRQNGGTVVRLGYNLWIKRAMALSASCGNKEVTKQHLFSLYDRSTLKIGHNSNLYPASRADN